ncbi:MAG: HDOD domain-containing protein [Myxococcales bacterium]|nr:HDOD domain-containing protein [Myxococcales bacterium]
MERRTVIEDYMGAHKKIGRYAKLPAPQSIVYEISALAGDDTISFHRVARVIEGDPMVSGALIQLANSAFYSEAPAVHDVLSAVRVVGLDVSITVSMGAVLSNRIGTLGATKAAYRQAWYEAILRAHVARHIARKACPTLMGPAYLIGLFLEVGQLALLANVRSYDILLSAWAHTPDKLAEVEVETLGVTSQEVLLHLCESWQLPASLAGPLCGMARPAASKGGSDNLKLAQIAHVLRCASICAARGGGVTDPAVNDYLLSAFSLDSDAYDAILKQAAMEVGSTRRIFGKTIPRGASIIADFADLRSELLDSRESREWLGAAPILIVSDEPGQVTIMQRMLDNLGASRRCTASSISEAVETAKRISPSMILLQREPKDSEHSTATSGERSSLSMPVSVHCTQRELGVALASEPRVASLDCHDESTLWRRIHNLRKRRYPAAPVL